MAAPSLNIYSSIFYPQNSWKILNPSTLVKLEKSSLICCSSKKKSGFMDQILDYIEGGPKLRKWYGAPELLPKDGGLEEQDEDELSPEVEEIRDAVLVTDGDSEIGQMVILSLIVKRVRIKAIVKNKRAAIEAFGTYVENLINLGLRDRNLEVSMSIVGDVSDPPFYKKALRGVRSIICPSSEDFLYDIESLRGIQHIVLLSQLDVYRGSNGIQALIQSNAKKLAERNETMVMASNIPYTIIRAGLLQSSQGGQQGFNFKQGSGAQGKLSKEDAAFICVEALNTIPQKGLVFEVANGNEIVSDWKEFFTSMTEKTGDQLQ